VDEQMSEQTSKRTNEQMNEQMNKRTNKQTNESMRRTTTGKGRDQVPTKDGIWHLLGAIIDKLIFC
jgi:hypothetical protein